MGLMTQSTGLMTFYYCCAVFITRRPRLAEHSIRGLKNPAIFDSFFMQQLYRLTFYAIVQIGCVLKILD